MAPFSRGKKAEEAEGTGTDSSGADDLMPSDVMRMKAERDVAGLIEAVVAYTTAAPMAATYLGELGDKSAVDALCQALEGRRMNTTKSNAAEALGRIGDPRAVGVLARALYDDDYSVRKEAANALASLGPDGESALLVAARDADPRIRSEGLGAMGPLESGATMEALLLGVEDDDEVVRSAAARSLNRREEVANFGALVSHESAVLGRLRPVPEEAARAYFAGVGIDQPNRYEDALSAFSGFRQFATTSEGARVLVSYVKLSDASARNDVLYVHLPDVPPLTFVVCTLNEGGFLGCYKKGTAVQKAQDI